MQTGSRAGTLQIWITIPALSCIEINSERMCSMGCCHPRSHKGNPLFYGQTYWYFSILLSSSSLEKQNHATENAENMTVSKNVT